MYGIALYDTGKRAEGVKVLDAALARHPYDRDILFALASYDRERGDIARAAKRAQILARLEPGNQDIARFARELDAAAARPR